eukprot:gene5041-34830_t
MVQDLGTQLLMHTGSQAATIEVHMSLKQSAQGCLHASWRSGPQGNGPVDPNCLPAAFKSELESIGQTGRSDDDSVDEALQIVLEEAYAEGSQMGTYHLFVLPGGAGNSSLTLGQYRHAWAWWGSGSRPNADSTDDLRNLLKTIAPKLAASFAAKIGPKASKDAAEMPVTSSKVSKDAAEIPATSPKASKDAAELPVTSSKVSKDAAEMPVTSPKASKDAAELPLLVLWFHVSKDAAEMPVTSLFVCINTCNSWLNPKMYLFLLAGPKASKDAAELPISAAGQAVLSFSLCNADPKGNGFTSWHFDGFEQRYVTPLVQALAPAVKLSIESQVLHYMRAQENGHWNKKFQAYGLKPSQLRFFLGSEWDLHVGRTAPTDASAREPPSASSATSLRAPKPSSLIPSHVLSFVAYVPPAAQQPLVVLPPKDSGGGDSLQRTLPTSDSFWIPSWGGVHIVNLGVKSGKEEEKKSSAKGTGDFEHERSVAESDMAEHGLTESRGAAPGPVYLAPATMHRFAEVMVAHLRSLMGLSMRDDLAAAEVEAPVDFFGVRHVNPVSTGLALWEVDALVRQMTSHDLATAGQLLGSFTRLVLSIPNLEMPHVIGSQVQESLDALELARVSVIAGRQADAHAAAVQARSHADAALSNPAVLAQLSFPESHKVGVYMPLFLPAALSLLQTLIIEIKRQLRKRKRQKEAKA